MNYFCKVSELVWVLQKNRSKRRSCLREDALESLSTNFLNLSQCKGWKTEGATSGKQVATSFLCLCLVTRPTANRWYPLALESFFTHSNPNQFYKCHQRHPHKIMLLVQLNWHKKINHHCFEINSEILCGHELGGDMGLTQPSPPKRLGFHKIV